jgi:peroxiredoxin
VSKDYGNVEIVPTTFIIDKKGNIAHKILGTRKKEELAKMIEALL